MINEILGAVLQVFVFTLIPFLAYLIRNRSAKGFLEYIGIKRSTRQANFLAVLACLLFALPLLVLTLINEDFREIMFDPASITGKFRQMGPSISSIVILLFLAVIKTSLAEEIFFRGFVAKRLISLFGYAKGNLLQAALFGGIHTALFAMITSNSLFLLLIFLVPAIASYVSAYLNEKRADGSIIPGWISHALANVLAYSIVGFVI